LLVDDDLMFLKMMSEWFSMKYNVTVSKSGMQAISFITKHKPDLILLDYDMPITPGPQVMEMIRSEPDSANIPIIFLTGNSDQKSVMRVMALKPQGYLLKTMDKHQIMETVDNFFKTQKWKNIQG
ncbi:MAG: response regulator, partial [Ruminiclostridium sp.]|nr:response regulator [Ruminiclostridium sp.]